MTKVQIVQLMTLMTALWPTYKAPTTKTEVEAVASMLLPVFGDVIYGDAVAAVYDLAKRGEHFAPAPGEIRAVAGSRAAMREELAENQAILNNLLKNIDGGRYDSLL